MEEVLIINQEKKFKILLYLKNKKVYGYKFNADNTITKVDRKFFEYFRTWFFKNFNYNIEKYYVNNGDYNLLFDKLLSIDDSVKKIKKRFKLNSNEVVITSLFSLSFLFSFFSADINSNNFFIDEEKYSVTSLNYDSLYNYNLLNNFSFQRNNYNINYILYLKNSINDTNYEVINDELIKNVFANYNYTVDDIFYLIDNSCNLNDVEKEFLKNKNIISKVLPYVNKDPYLKYVYLNRFYNLDIVPFTSIEESYATGGYYVSDNKLHVCNYNGNLEEKDIVAHEYMHVFQYPSAEYGFLIESSAELMSYEFYNDYDIKLDGYTFEVSRLKVLMEIIGQDPIFEYNITGNFSSIEKNVKPYLSESDYENFCNILKKATVGLDNEEEIIFNLDCILKKLYLNKLGKDMLSDENIVNIYVKKDKNKYYFNEKKLNKDYTIIEDCDNIYNSDFIKRKKYILN